MQKVYYYIGSNNETKELEVKKIETVLSKYFDGFTTYEVAGYWKGQREKTLKVEIVTAIEPAKLVAIAKLLAKELGQEAVMTEIIESNVVFVQAQEEPSKPLSMLELAASLCKPFGVTS